MSHKRIRSVGLKGFARALVHGITVVLSAGRDGECPLRLCSADLVNVDPDQVLQDSQLHLGRRGAGEKDLIVSQTFGCVGRCLRGPRCVGALSGGIVMATATDVAPLSPARSSDLRLPLGGFGTHGQRRPTRSSSPVTGTRRSPTI